MRDVLAKMREISQTAGFPTRLRNGWHLCQCFSDVASYQSPVNSTILLLSSSVQTYSSHQVVCYYISCFSIHCYQLVPTACTCMRFEFAQIDLATARWAGRIAVGTRTWPVSKCSRNPAGQSEFLYCNMYRIMEILHCDIYSSIEEALDISILQNTTLLLSAVCTGRHRVLFTSLPLVIEAAIHHVIFVSYALRPRDDKWYK